MCKITLGDNNQAHQRASDRAIESLAIVEQLKNSTGKMILQQGDDATVEDHENSEENENTPNNVYIVTKQPHYLK